MNDPNTEGFVLTIADVFRITGRGTAVTGRIEAGTIRAGDTVEIRDGETLVATTQVRSIDAAVLGPVPETVGLLLGDIDKELLHSGQIVRVARGKETGPC